MRGPSTFGALWAALLAVVCASFAASATPARAQSAAEAEAEGERLFAEAIALKDQGKWCDAAVKFAKSHEVWPDPKKVVNVGVSQDKCGKLLEARATLTAFVTENANIAEQAGNVKKVRAFLETLATRIPGIRIELTGLVAGDEVRVDGKPVDPTAAANDYVELNPGDHEITVERRTGMAAREKFSVARGERRVVPMVVPPPCRDDDKDDRCDDACVDQNLDGKCDKDSCSDWDDAKGVCLDGGAAAGKSDDGSLFEEPVFWIVTGVVVAGLVVGGVVLFSGGGEKKKPAPDDFGGPFKPSVSGASAGLITF